MAWMKSPLKSAKHVSRQLINLCRLRQRVWLYAAVLAIIKRCKSGWQLPCTRAATLTNKRITAFIDQFAEPQRTMMLQQIAADWQLREALRSPLLLNLYLLLPGLFTMPDAAAATYADSVEARRRNLFAARLHCLCPAGISGICPSKVS